MARIRIRALTSKIQQFRRAIGALIKDFRPVWSEQVPIVRAEFERKLTTSSYPGITLATRNWRRRHGYPVANPPLRASGRLLRSLQGGAGEITIANRTTLEVGTNLPEAAPNHFGAEVTVRKKSEKQRESGRGRKSKTILYRFYIPSRPFVPNPQDETFAGKISRQLESFLNRYVLQKVSEPPTKPTEGD